MADSYSAVRVEITKPFPGAIETLHHLRGRGVGLALVTGGDGAFQRRKVENNGLDSIFDAVLIEGELGYGKPDERIYLEALRARHGRDETDRTRCGHRPVFANGAEQ